MNNSRLDALETEIREELFQRFNGGETIHHPITDGVVDDEQYLAAKPKILWILKEPWEQLAENEGGGGWSVTKDLIPKLIMAGTIGGIPTYRKMAYVSYAVFNGFTDYSDIKYCHEDPAVPASLRKIAYINVNKFPGKSLSNPVEITAAYGRNQNILKRQIDAIAPDVIIAGNILHLFFETFGITQTDLQYHGVVDYCYRKPRLYINAYHPSYWRCKEERYVNDIVQTIKNHCPLFSKS